jgi:hypothetical protein
VCQVLRLPCFSRLLQFLLGLVLLAACCRHVLLDCRRLCQSVEKVFWLISRLFL